jgi:hypothetical protein
MNTMDNTITKSLYKIELLLIKVTPFIISIGYIIDITLSYFNIHSVILNYIIDLSLIPFIILYTSSFVFRFCIYHRLPLYYILILDSIHYYQCNNSIEIYYKHLTNLILISIGIIMLILVYIKNKEHEQTIK